MTDHPQEHDNMSITHCQIDRSSDTCTPHEHESLSAFIEKVEASGEDRKHKPLGWIHPTTANPRTTMIYGVTIHFDAPLGEWNVPIYTQQQLDDAVRAERERIAAWIETQRNDVPACGFEFANAIRHAHKDHP